MMSAESGNERVQTSWQDHYSGLSLVGLTGTIACGKTTVAKMLAEKGAHIIDFDDLARRVVVPGKPAYEEIVSFFGREILQADDTLDRKKLSAIVFNDADKRKKLEGMTHPRISGEFLTLLGEIAAVDSHAIVVAVIPLLIEQNMQGRFQKIIVVYAPTETLLQRLIKRDRISRKTALCILSSQISMDDKIPFADYVINNSGVADETQKRTAEVWEQLLEWKRGV